MSNSKQIERTKNEINKELILKALEEKTKEEREESILQSVSLSKLNQTMAWIFGILFKLINISFIQLLFSPPNSVEATSDIIIGFSG